MVAMLLDKLDPNERRDGSTPWLNLVDHVHSMSKTPRPIFDNWVDVCKLFLIHGAKVGDTIQIQLGAIGTPRQVITSGEALLSVFQELHLKSASDLCAMIIQKMGLSNYEVVRRVPGRTASYPVALENIFTKPAWGMLEDLETGASYRRRKRKRSQHAHGHAKRTKRRDK